MMDSCFMDDSVWTCCLTCAALFTFSLILTRITAEQGHKEWQAFEYAGIQKNRKADKHTCRYYHPHSYANTCHLLCLLQSFNDLFHYWIAHGLFFQIYWLRIGSMKCHMCPSQFPRVSLSCLIPNHLISSVGKAQTGNSLKFLFDEHQLSK